MKDVLVRNIDEHALEVLGRRAKEADRSLGSELKRVIEQAARAADSDAARELADRIAADLAGREHADSAELVREGRDR
jgi:hypothetical protein